MEKEALLDPPLGGRGNNDPFEKRSFQKWIKKLRRLNMQRMRKDAIVSLYELVEEVKLYSVLWRAINDHKHKPDGISL